MVSDVEHGRMCVLIPLGYKKFKILTFQYLNAGEIKDFSV